MKKILFTILIFLSLLFITISCKNRCECTQWTNSVEGQSYIVDLEADGSYCQYYTEIDTSNDVINGVICKEIE
jgi:uncharacterized lipoprotein NlpE involved in copper resistance